MRRQLGWAVATAVLLIALPGSALGGAARHAANSQTFPDSLGEDPASADITTVVVSNDDAGLITWKINISNRPNLTTDMSIVLYLDTDQRASTGDQRSFGAEYAIELDSGAVSLFKWNGTDFVAAPSQSTLIFSYDSTGATIKVNATDLGGIKALNFVALTISGIVTAANGDADFTNAHFDFAPDPGHGTFAYQVLTTLKLSVVSFVKTPALPRAGGVFSESLAANENDTGGPVTQGTVICSATIAGKHLVTLKSGFANGVATCSWKIPKTAKHKTFKGTITLSVRGTTVTRSFSGLAR